MKRKAMILAAGFGTRLGEATADRPKILIDIGGITLLEWITRKLVEHGFSDIIINIHHCADMIEEKAPAIASRTGASFTFSNEREKLLDTGGGLYKAREFFGKEPFLLYNGDIVTDLDLTALYRYNHATEALATLALRQREAKRVFIVDSGGRLAGWFNRQSGERIMVNHSKSDSPLVGNRPGEDNSGSFFDGNRMGKGNSSSLVDGNRSGEKNTGGTFSGIRLDKENLNNPISSNRPGDDKSDSPLVGNRPGEDNSGNSFGGNQPGEKKPDNSFIGNLLTKEVPFTAVSVINPRIFRFMNEGVYSIRDVYLKAAASALVNTYEDGGGFWLDIGSPESLEKCRNLLLGRNSDLELE